jgi:hypothetical protein
MVTISAGANMGALLPAEYEQVAQSPVRHGSDRRPGSRPAHRCRGGDGPEHGAEYRPSTTCGVGLHLVLIGYLACLSGYVPRVLGILLVIAGGGYLYDSFSGLLMTGCPWRCPGFMAAFEQHRNMGTT